MTWWRYARVPTLERPLRLRVREVANNNNIFNPLVFYTWLKSQKNHLIVIGQCKYKGQFIYHSLNSLSTVYQSKTRRPNINLWLAITPFSMTQGSKVRGNLKNLGKSPYDGHWNLSILTKGSWENWDKRFQLVFWNHNRTSFYEQNFTHKKLGFVLGAIAPSLLSNIQK